MIGDALADMSQAVYVAAWIWNACIANPSLPSTASPFLHPEKIKIPAMRSVAERNIPEIALCRAKTVGETRMHVMPD